MATTTTPPSALKNDKKRSLSDLSLDELILEIQSRDKLIQRLQAENKRQKTTSPAAAAAAVAPAISPEKAEANALRLAEMMLRGMKSQMKYKPSLKRSNGRVSFTSFCDEPTFRAFMELEAKDKTKGGKKAIEDFEDLLGGAVRAKIRFGYLRLVNENVNITFSKDAEEIKVTGYYGL